MKTLIMYFSAEKGRTKTVAEMMAAEVGADLFAIEPVEAYTDADLNYLNPLSRVNKEKLGGKEIAVKGLPENFAEYEKVVIGFPIWYAGAPNIVKQFCEKLDFTGKKVSIYATSIASKLGKAAEKLQPSIKGAKIEAAERFTPEEEEAIKAWIVK